MPCNNDKTDLVAPHDGQGMLVTDLNIHAFKDEACTNISDILTYSQAYPEKQAKIKMIYNFCLVNAIIQN